MLNIYLKEINSFLSSLIAYIAIIVFLMAMGLLVWVFPETNIIDYGYADMGVFFSMGPFVLMFLIPAITMKMLSEETNTGTIEILVVKPVTKLQIVLGKYFAALTLVAVAIIPTLVYYFSLYEISSPSGNIDTAGIAGSYIGLFLLSSVFCSLGILTSSSTKNQVIAFIVATFLSFILFTGLNSLAGLNVWSSLSLPLSKLSLEYHYNAMSKGLLDTRNIIYFLSVNIVLLYFSTLILAHKK
jgi:gliding motility-associated transport system permease protein